MANSFRHLFRTRLSAVIFLVLMVSAVQSGQQKAVNLKVAVDLVLLDVSVQDKDGQPVRNLEQKSFKVYEDKLEQPIASFSAEESPVTWGLVLDRSSIMQHMMKDVYESALNVINPGTTEDDIFIVVVITDGGDKEHATESGFQSKTSN